MTDAQVERAEDAQPVISASSPAASVMGAGGAALLLLALAWFLGWQQNLGRLDPALVVPWLLPVLLWRCWRLRGVAPSARIRNLALTWLLLIGAQALMASLWTDAGWGMLLRHLLAVTLFYALATALSSALMRVLLGHWALRWLLGLGAGCLWLVLAHALLSWGYQPRAAKADAATATMITGLPLRWSGSVDFADILSGQSEDDVFLQHLEGLGPISLVDSLNGKPLPQGSILFLAHPRALAPQDLAAVDAHVRGGGQALILADALSSWPMAHPLGDARNAPITSLLTPLLDHWGVTLDGAVQPEAHAHGPTSDLHSDMGQSGDVLLTVEGQDLRLHSAGRFSQWPSGCTDMGRAYVLRCQIGQGSVWLVGDADMLHAPLWQADGWDAAHLEKSEVLSWVAGHIWGDAAGRPLLRPLWLRSGAGAEAIQP